MGPRGDDARGGGVEVHAEERRAFFADVELALTTREFDVLARLAERPGWVLTPDQLSDDGYLGGASPDAVNVHVSHLRAKLTDAGAPADLIETVRGVGWRLQRPSGHLTAAQATELVGLCIARARSAAADRRYEDAIGLLDEALEHLGNSELDALRACRVRSAVLERRGAAHVALQNQAVGRADYEAALSARPVHDHHARVRLHTRIAYASLFERSRGAAESALTRALAELEQIEARDRGWWRAWIEIRLQQAQAMYLTDLPLCADDDDPELGEAVEAHGTAAQRAKYHLSRADKLFYRGRWVVTSDCLTETRRGVEYALATDSAFLQSLAVGELGSLLVFAGEYAEAEVRLRQAIDLATRCRDAMGVMAATMFLSVAARLQCDVRRAERYALELKTMVVEHVVAPEFECAVPGQLAWVALRRGDLVEAERLSEEALQLWERDPSMSQGVWMMAWPAVSCALAVGDVERAVEYATLMTRSDQQVLPAEMDRRLAEAVALHHGGKTDAAESLLRELEAEARTLGYA